jgi:sugar lactone lactonase YvrE
MRVQQLDVPVCTLGEGPVWSDRDGCLYYVDILAYRLHAYTPSTQQHRAWTFETYVGSLAECRSGGLILSLGDRVVRFDPRTSGTAVEELVVLEADRPYNRLNDGKVDPWGRFWVGSLRVEDGPKSGRLWCVTPDGKTQMVRDGIGCSNSAAFDLTRRRMYFADSTLRLIEHAEFDAELRLGAFQPFARLEAADPDGSCTDAAGYLWNAEWDGHRIRRYAPDGTVERELAIPTSRPSCCTFGGERHRTLFVTSAHVGMTAEQRAQDPRAGGLFSIELDDVEGSPADLFAL